MPLYEFQCDACGRRFEMIRKFSDPPLDVCPTCGKGPVRKLMSSPAIQFKGSGFYITDYAKKEQSGKKEKPDKSHKADKAEGAEKTETKGEAAKAEAAKTESAGTEKKTEKPSST